MGKYDKVAVTDETTLATRTVAPPPSPAAFAGLALDADAARGVAEVLGAIAVARQVGRDEVAVWKEMRRITSRYSFCEQAIYSYRRAGSLIEGGTIRLIEELARAYGHITAGWRELERTDTGAKVETYARDTLTNTYATRQVIIPFIRDKRDGGVELTDQRDRYELMANYAARRMRACIEQLLPADYIDEALERVRSTLEKGDGTPLADRIRDMTLAFGEFGVRPQDLEARLGHPLDVVTPAQLVQLRAQYNAIRGGADPQDLFPRAASPRAGAQDAAGAPQAAAAPPPSDETPDARTATHAPSTDAQGGDPESDADGPDGVDVPDPEPVPSPPDEDADERAALADPDLPEVAAEVLAEAQRLGLDLNDPDIEAKVAAARKPKGGKKRTDKTPVASNGQQGSLV